MNSYAILLVEDERAFALGLKRELEAAGSKVECVQSADQGLIRAKEGTFDAVVTDLHLPGRLGLEPFSGLRLVTEVQRVAPRLPVILMTAFHTADAAIEAIKLGAYDYVTKPLPSSQGGL